jgi:chromosomal replication initiator protein
LLVDIQPPDIETRLAILQIKAERQSIIIPAEVLEFIARKIQKNIRELEGTLNRVIAYARLTRNSISIELAERAIQDITSSGSRRQTITPTQIIDAVARYFNLDHEMLQSKKRDKQLTSARHVAMYLIREETNCSLIEIGRLLGGRDHSTVLHGCQKIATNINIDSHLRHDVLEIKDNLYSKMARRGLTT